MSYFRSILLQESPFEPVESASATDRAIERFLCRVLKTEGGCFSQPHLFDLKVAAAHLLWESFRLGPRIDRRRDPADPLRREALVPALLATLNETRQDGLWSSSWYMEYIETLMDLLAALGGVENREALEDTPDWADETMPQEEAWGSYFKPQPVEGPFFWLTETLREHLDTLRRDETSFVPRGFQVENAARVEKVAASLQKLGEVKDWSVPDDDEGWPAAEGSVLRDFLVALQELTRMRRQ